MIRSRFFSRFVISFLVSAVGLVFTGFISIANDTPAISVETDATGDVDGHEVDVPTLGEIDPVGESVEPFDKPSSVELRKRLSKRQFQVTQDEATEPAHRNKYWKNKQVGVYECIVCGQDLFASDTKYKSGTGWPSFFMPLSESKVGYKSDRHLFYTRTEVHCSRCRAHLGHVFDDGPKPTGKRFCMNSASLNFVKSEPNTSPKRKRVNPVQARSASE